MRDLPPTLAALLSDRTILKVSAALCPTRALSIRPDYAFNVRTVDDAIALARGKPRRPERAVSVPSLPR